MKERLAEIRTHIISKDWEFFYVRPNMNHAFYLFYYEISVAEIWPIFYFQPLNWSSFMGGWVGPLLFSTAFNRQSICVFVFFISNFAREIFDMNINNDKQAQL